MEGEVTMNEITLRQFVESTWFKLLGRGAAILGTLIASCVGVYFLTLGERVTAIEQARVISTVQNSQRLGDLDTKVGELGTEVAAIRADTGVLKVQTARIAGVLEALRRDLPADYQVPDFGAAPIPTSLTPIPR